MILLWHVLMLAGAFVVCLSAVAFHREIAGGARWCGRGARGASMLVRLYWHQMQRRNG